MQALYLEIKNLIITTLNLDELTAEDIDPMPRCLAMGWVSTLSTRWNWVWP